MDDLGVVFESFGLTFNETIAKGGYGTVYKVYSEYYKQNFAIKKIPANKFNDNEIACMIEIRSSSIVPLYKYLRYKDFVYLLMEYCPSSIDKIFLERRALTSEELYRYAFGMAQSLHSCHEFGITHGDVKPSNFLIDKYGRVKICDFGFSQKLKRDENNTNFSGTFIYESPEIIKQEPFDGFAADIWALGVSYFILITGQCPWNLYSKDAMIKSIQNAIFDEFQINDLFLRRIVSLCLQLDPTKRPKAEDLVNCLHEKIENGRKKLIRPISSALFATPLMKSKTHARIRHVSSF